MPVHKQDFPRSLTADSADNFAAQCAAEGSGMRVAVLGPGLLGGSVALALRQYCPQADVRIWGRRAEAVEAIRAANIVDMVDTDISQVVAGADLVLLATPVGVMEAVLTAAAPSLKAGCVVTDVGSVKEAIVTKLTPVAERAGAIFVGSHPMAGSENGGMDNADAHLFQGAACLITPSQDSPTAAVTTVASFWEALGCSVSQLSPERHDTVVGKISHLPHVVASAVVNVALEAEPEIAQFSGGGFRDSTRIAAGDAELWSGILGENASVTATLLRETAVQLEELAAALDAEDRTAVFGFLDRARKLRHSCSPRPSEAG